VNSIIRAAGIVILAICMLLLPVSLKRWTHSFHPSRLLVSLPGRVCSDIPPRLSQEELAVILSQEFSYLSRGSQAFVFSSHDRRYVLKLFLFDSPQHVLSHRFYSKNDPSLLQKTEEKAIKTLEAARTAYQYLPEETGLLYLHLDPSEGMLPSIRIKGPAWRRGSLSLDRYRFVLQKRARPLQDVLWESCRGRNRAEFCHRIDSLAALLDRRIQCGIYNSDPTLFDNFGFVENHAVEIDFGNYVYCPHLFKGRRPQEEKARYMGQLLKWIQLNMPEWKDDVAKRMEGY
jgi:hypothetical protein